MEGIVLFRGKHGEWSYSRRAGEDVTSFLSDVHYIVSTRADAYIEQNFDVSALTGVLDEIIRTRNVDKAVSSAVRSRNALSAINGLLSQVSEYVELDKKHTAAFKDIFKAYSVRYVVARKIGDFEHFQDVGEEYEPMPEEGYQFIANRGGWTVIKKQKITEKTTPADILIYLSSVSASVHQRLDNLLSISAKKQLPSEAHEFALRVSEGGDYTKYDHAFRVAMAASGFPVHYGVAYNRIRPPKRIRGVKMK